MKINRFTSKLYLTAFLLSFGLLTVAEGKERAAVPAVSPSFDLADQFEKLHKFDFPRSNVTVLVVADRSGSKQLEGWIRPIYKRYEKRIDIWGIADLGTVPGRLQKFVRSSFKKRSDYPILLDWTGKASASFGYLPKKANCYLVDRDGKILLHFVGEADTRSHRELFEIVDQLLRPAK